MTTRVNSMKLLHSTSNQGVTFLTIWFVVVVLIWTSHGTFWIQRDFPEFTTKSPFERMNEQEKRGNESENGRRKVPSKASVVNYSKAEPVPICVTEVDQNQSKLWRKEFGT